MKKSTGLLALSAVLVVMTGTGLHAQTAQQKGLEIAKEAATWAGRTAGQI